MGEWKGVSSGQETGAAQRGGGAGRLAAFDQKGSFPPAFIVIAGRAPSAEWKRSQSDNTAQLCPPSKRRDLMGAGIFKGKQTNKVGVGF